MDHAGASNTPSLTSAMSQVGGACDTTFIPLTICTDALTTLVEFYAVQDQETMHPHIITLQSVRNFAKGL